MRACPNVLTVQGTEGVLCTFNEPKKDGNAAPRYGDYYMNADGYHEIEVETHDTGHGDYTRCRNFLDAVFDDAPLIAPLADAIRTSELLHAIKDSHDHRSSRSRLHACAPKRYGARRRVARFGGRRKVGCEGCKARRGG